MKKSSVSRVKIGAAAVVFLIALLTGFRQAAVPSKLAAARRPQAAQIPTATRPVNEPSSGEVVAASEADTVPALLARLAQATPPEVLKISDELVAQGRSAEAGLIAALQNPRSAATHGIVANLLGRIGSDEGIQAVITAATIEEDPLTREALISGLTAGVSTPEAAGLLATAAIITDDPALLAPIIETVGRLGNPPVLGDLISLYESPGTTAGQQVIIAQMIGGMRNPDLTALLAAIIASDQTAVPLKDAARRALPQP